MGEPDDPSLFHSVKSKAQAIGLGPRDTRPVLPQHNSIIHGTTPSRTSTLNNPTTTTFSEKPTKHNGPIHRDCEAQHNNDAAGAASTSPAPASLADNTPVTSEGTAPIEPKPPMMTRMKNGSIRFCEHFKDALLHSWINVLLIFVPIGIAVHPAGLQPEIVFAINAIAIIPLAGLLAYATEAVALRVGDTLGALLNVSFGNAVELILFVILLAGNQIRVVQAALLGSILANLLLILGMAFLFGGLRYQEQVYNSTITQMSACMLSLAVMSLLLPTAFHSAFSNYSTADQKTLQVSRGTSVILLLVYVLYLVFQLKSHSYMYASTPQHIIDEESHPGLLADILNSSSSDSSSDSSSADSDSSSGSHTTANRIKRAFKNRRRRKSSVSSKDTPSVPSVMSSPSVEHHRQYFEAQRNGVGENEEAVFSQPMSPRGSVLNAIMSGDEADDDERAHVPVVRDFSANIPGPPNKKEKRVNKHNKKHRKRPSKEFNEKKEMEIQTPTTHPAAASPKVAFADDVQTTEIPAASKRLRPLMPSLLSNNVFVNPQNPPPPPGSAITNIRVAGPRALRRTTSLPDRMNRIPSTSSTMRNGPPVSQQSSGIITVVDGETSEKEIPLMSRTAAIVMLVISTGLVAVCADFLSDAIEPMVQKTGISEAFIGLIILPIVGNAAEHVTAVVMATKNKMDLAIGVAVGSSIQIGMYLCLCICPLLTIASHLHHAFRCPAWLDHG
jgi:Ca2+:H+ antiporter